MAFPEKEVTHNNSLLRQLKKATKIVETLIREKNVIRAVRFSTSTDTPQITLSRPPYVYPLKSSTVTICPDKKQGRICKRVALLEGCAVYWWEAYQ